MHIGAREKIVDNRNDIVLLVVAVGAKCAVTVPMSSRIIEEHIVMMLMHEGGEAQSIHLAIRDAMEIQNGALRRDYRLDEPTVELEAISSDDVYFFIGKIEFRRGDGLTERLIKLRHPSPRLEQHDRADEKEHDSHTGKKSDEQQYEAEEERQAL